jgi:hypothetical protein
MAMTWIRWMTRRDLLAAFEVAKNRFPVVCDAVEKLGCLLAVLWPSFVCLGVPFAS